MRYAWIIAAAAGLALFGCQKTTTEGTEVSKQPSGKKLQIAVIPKGSTHEFWKSVHAGANQAAEELGVEIIWKGPLKEDDREDQIKVVDDFVTRKVDGIVLAPLDDAALRMPVESAKENAIKVVIIDSALKDSAGIPFVATDNRKGGFMGGEALVEAVGGSGKLILLRYQEGSASTNEREAGFMDAVKDKPGITMLSDNQYGGATTETAQRASENLISRFKNPDGTLQADGIFTPNESTTFGMLRALQDAGFAGKVKFVGFDASPKLVEALRKGEIQGLVLQNPRKMGYEGVKAAVAAIRGETVPDRVDTGATLVTAKNIDEPEIAKLVAPPAE